MRIRAATANDIISISEVHVDSWRTTYKGIVPDPFLANLNIEQRKRYWDYFFEQKQPEDPVWVAETDDGQIVGFANGGKSR
ncbi:GNAT family N-acetyltransferase [Paenibacillus protaetiae]|uniref:GNAT family N-acetyltransferase n=1 Tax=Paenibacillus protaetiae TaxID=2509456 RepID=A0A4P6ERJ4_9BACL|nr:hypothetical protein [Paenibacillus protaetiae]QAY65670.1 hypothetical protein ET464_04005 [Paenibacillus protaetiae]